MQSIALSSLPLLSLGSSIDLLSDQMSLPLPGCPSFQAGVLTEMEIHWSSYRTQKITKLYPCSRLWHCWDVHFCYSKYRISGTFGTHVSLTEGPRICKLWCQNCQRFELSIRNNHGWVCCRSNVKHCFKRSEAVEGFQPPLKVWSFDHQIWERVFTQFVSWLYGFMSWRLICGHGWFRTLR